MNSFGVVFRISVFGESHGPAIGVVIDGCPPGIPVNPDDFIADFLCSLYGVPISEHITFLVTFSLDRTPPAHYRHNHLIFKRPEGWWGWTWTVIGEIGTAGGTGPALPRRPVHWQRLAPTRSSFGCWRSRGGRGSRRDVCPRPRDPGGRSPAEADRCSCPALRAALLAAAAVWRTGWRRAPPGEYLRS